VNEAAQEFLVNPIIWIYARLWRCGLIEVNK